METFFVPFGFGVLMLLDVLLFEKTPYEFRRLYWWRYVPLGGIAVWTYWMLREG